MAEFFPREHIAWRLEEPSFLRRLTLRLLPYALTVGVALRLYRWAVLTLLAPEGPLLLIVAVVLGTGVLGALTAGHLASFPLLAWKWRAPLFGVCVALGESLTSLLLTLAGQERVGRAAATLADWLPNTLWLLATRVAVVAAFAAVLAVVVHLVQRRVPDPPRPPSA